ncbi:(2Fe-2S) ferredoxin domain-containing protein [Williamwhitmania taraxaci]|uniref:Thioredoxin-like [2Fe-2S] ferredoxin n=1 Tax=Williamwhitmania taraxaci TaxID=1640674 RepID=A0A1G6NS71_9BACT|nr:(2Fe-2S) ferredoxin domain-containing protein [Williamwhitmania taraxaci]SDC70568.1 Thioredoxin-like [2Fe-2S] ferredoxin [Williamwhitmania taraxaci]
MNDLKKIEIKICLGSSCFSRGNRIILQEINSYIETKRVKDRVFFHGAHCFGDCNDGPKIEVNGKLYCKVTSSMVLDILNEAFGF